MDAAAPAIPNHHLSQPEIYNDFLNRRAGILEALTTDVDEFFEQCDPDKGPMCLYGLPNRTWQVGLPTENVPPPMPEPIRGINFVRDRMERKDWLAVVAHYRDTWLLAVACFHTGCDGHDKESRKWIYDRINDHSTLRELMTGNHRLSQVDISRDILDRRAGIYKALTCDVDEFSEQCDPDKGPMCLYGLPNRTWQVRPPTENVPPPMPEPILGINFVRDRMERKDWLAVVAHYSDTWLLAVAFFHASCHGHDKESRKWIYERINDYPTLHELMTGNVTTRPWRRHRTRKIKDILTELDDKMERVEKEQVEKEREEEDREEERDDEDQEEEEESEEEDQEDKEEEEDQDEREEDERDDEERDDEVQEEEEDQEEEDERDDEEESEEEDQGDQGDQEDQEEEEESEEEGQVEEEDQGERQEEQEEEKREEDQKDKKDICADCGKTAGSGEEFWLSCVACGRKYHGLCLGIWPDNKEHIENSKCSSECSAKPAIF